MGLYHIKELHFGRRSSRLVLVVSDLVSDLEVLVVSAVGLTSPNLRLGWMVLLIGASPSRSCTSVLFPGSLELRGLEVVTAGTVPKCNPKLGAQRWNSSVHSQFPPSLALPCQRTQFPFHPSAPERLGSTRLVLQCCQNGSHQWLVWYDPWLSARVQRPSGSIVRHSGSQDFSGCCST